MRFDVKTEPEVDIETKQAMTTVHIVNCEILSLFIYNNNNYKDCSQTWVQQQVSSQLVYTYVKFFTLSARMKKKAKVCSEVEIWGLWNWAKFTNILGIYL